MFRRDRGSRRADNDGVEMNGGDDHVTPPHQSNEKQSRLPLHRPEHHQKSKGLNPEGESNRRGIHPLHFIRICFRSSCTLSMIVNLLWPVVPAAIAVHFAYQYREERKWHLIIFILNYIAMVPSANLIGFAGQDLARKLPKAGGVLLETSLGSVTEIILFVTLVAQRQNLPVVRGAILGAILANLLLCLGLCFIAGGFQREEQVFHEVISEVGSGLLLVAGFGLVIPAAFASVYSNTGGDSVDPRQGTLLNPEFQHTIIRLSRATAIILIIAFVIFVYFQTTSHEGLYDEVLGADEQRDKDRHKDLAKMKLTLTECIVALVIGIACTAMIAVFLVTEIPQIIGEGRETPYVSEAFMGLILIPVVEKAAEHITAIDEAWDNQANFALTHVLGASVQTALLNTPIAVFVGWGMTNYDLDLLFPTFESVVLILAIIVVGNFLRDGKSNYLEGVLCVCVYVIIAVCAFYYPSPEQQGAAPHGSEGEH
ncbi:MAG: hypothetical protein M1831_005120 [Alyxoria varia]|nr:MAG: hypothetical protein M1831_005120 [Alyxoria varia]